jgi:hypothetical protein
LTKNANFTVNRTRNTQPHRPNDSGVIHNTIILELDRLAAIRKDISLEGDEVIPKEGDKRR